MSGNPEKLSTDDIGRLIGNPSADSRIEIADKLARQYKSQSFTPEQLAIAEQIFRLLLKDAEVHVRYVLAENLKEVKTIPHDVALQLARDAEYIALPMLEFCEVLTDDDLVSIVSGTVEVARQMAVAKRKNLSDKISSALIDTKNEDVVERLLYNQNAKISSESFDKVSQNFPNNENILGALLDHSAATMEVAEKVMARVSDNLRRHLSEKHKIAVNKLGGVFDKSREAATIRFLGAKTSDAELARLMNYLEEHSGFTQELQDKQSKLAGMIEGLELSGKLTPFTALCLGSMSLFEITLARLAKVSIYNVRKLAADESDQGLKALYEKAGLPESMYEPLRIVVGVVRGIDKEKPEVKDRLKKPENLSNYMIEKIMTVAEEQEIENINYFLSMINLYAKKSA